jgi:hypothetical protein
MFGFERELEEHLDAWKVINVDVRNVVAIARGHLELARDHGVPLPIADVESELVRAAEGLGNQEWRIHFITRLRGVAAWGKLT